MSVRKKRVLLVLHKLDFGGIEMSTLHYIWGFDKTKFEFDVVLTSDVVGGLESDYLQAGANVFHLGSARNIGAFRKRFRQFLSTRQYDIIETAAEVYAAIWMSEAARNIPVRILVAHNSRNNDISNRSRLGVQSLLQYYLRKLPNLWATDFAAVSNEAAAFSFSRRQLKQVQILHNPINFNAFEFSESSRGNIRTKLGIGNGSIVLGCIGRLVYQKNHEFLLQIMTQLPEQFQLIICGDGDLRASLERTALNLGVRKRVIFAGSLTQEQVADYLTAFDIFLLPSRFEGLGIAALEAMTSGLPCLVSDQVPLDFSELPEQIAQNVKQLSIASHADAQDWATQILQIAQNLMISEGGGTRLEAVELMNQTKYALQGSVHEKLAFYEGALNATSNK